MRVRALRTGSWASTGEVGQGDDEGESGAKDHPPDGNLECCTVGFGAYRGKLEVFVCCQLGYQGGEESDHPKLAEEDEDEDEQDEDYGCEDTFHAF